MMKQVCASGNSAAIPRLADSPGSKRFDRAAAAERRAPEGSGLQKSEDNCPRGGTKSYLLAGKLAEFPLSAFGCSAALGCRQVVHANLPDWAWEPW